MGINSINAVSAPTDPFTATDPIAAGARSAAGEAAPLRGDDPGRTGKGPGPLSGVRVSFSEEARLRAAGEAEERAKPAEEPNALSEEEEQEVQDLKRRDREVRQHEQAHMAAAGAYARGGARFDYDRGPDGHQYATGGEVSIDVGAERTPEASVRKAQVVRRAALAPADPSPADRAVAAAASQLETKARRAIAEASRGETEKAREAAQPLAPENPAGTTAPAGKPRAPKGPTGTIAEAVRPKAPEGPASPMAEAGKPLTSEGPAAAIAKPGMPLAPDRPAGTIAKAISPADFDPSSGPATKTLDIQI